MKLRIDGRVHEVDARVEDGAVTLTIDGRTTRVDLQRDADGTLTLTADGKRVRGASDGAWVVVDGRARRIERVATAAVEVLPDRVTPPMPAVVVNVLVAVGDVVKRGDRLVVVSAMKTETALKAPKDGVVTAVNVVVGQTVTPGEELVLFAAG